MERQGAINWFFATGGPVISSPAIAKDGTVYVGSNDGNLYAVNGSTGTANWAFSAGAAIESSPTIGTNGNIYFGADNGTVYALNPTTGGANWTFSTGGNVVSSPSLGNDGTVYVSSEDGNVYALNGVLGTENWVFQSGAPIESSPAVGLNGNVYVGSDDGTVYGLNGTTGAMIWERAVYAQFVNTSPAIGPDGTVFIGANSNLGFFYAIDGATGAVKWNFASGQYVESSPAVAADGTVYFGGSTSSGTGVIYALNGTTGVQEWAFGTGDTSGIFSSPAIGGDGTVYFGSNDGNVYALVGVHAQSLGIYPYEITGGNSTLGTVSISAPAPAGGVTVSLASDTASVVVPATVLIPAGQSVATFTISTSAVDAYTSAKITASFGVILSATLTVDPASVWSLTLDPSSLLGGSSSTATVTLDGPAGPSGVVINLSSNNIAATVPNSITFEPGQTSGTFTVSTTAVTGQVSADITAAIGGTSQTATLKVLSPAVLSLTLAPPTLTGGSTSTGTVTINAPAGPDGVVVSLSTGTTTATVPPTVTIAPGDTTATFPITTASVSNQTTVVVTAAIGDNWQTANLTINAPQLVSISLSPDSVAQGASTTGTVTINGPAPFSGVVILLTSNNSSARVPTSVTIGSGQTFATFPVTTSTVTKQAVAVITGSVNGSVQSTNLTLMTLGVSSITLNPSTVAGGTAATGTVTLNGISPKGGTVVLLTSNSPWARVPYSVYVAAGKVSVVFNATTSPVATQKVVTITCRVGSSTPSATLTITPPTVVAVSLKPSTVPGGKSSVGTVTLSSPAAAGGAVVQLSSSNSVATVPTTVTVGAGGTSATFTVKTSAVGGQATSTIKGSLNGGSASATLTVTSPVIVSLKLNPATVVGGKSSTGTVTVSSAAPTGGLVVSLASTSGSATVPGSVTIAAGKTSATFSVATTKGSGKTTATITGTLGTSAKAAVLTIN